MKAFLRSCLTVALVTAMATAAAQSYPVKPVRLVVPYASGESMDVTARMVAEKWSTALGQQLVVDNRPGASALLGSEYVAKAAPDGYTLLYANVGPLAISPSLYTKMPYDVTKDFAPLAQVANLPFVLYVSPTLPVNSLKEFVDYVKARPGQLNYASIGTGGGLHLTAELLKSIVGIDIVHVPFKGTSQAVPEIIAGRVQMVCNTIPAFQPHVKSGRIKALVVAATRRSALLPEVPTAVEVGIPDFQASSWHGVVLPSGAPREVVAKLNQSLASVLSTPAFREQLIAQGAEPVESTPDEFAKFLRSDIEKWRKVIQSLGVKLDL